MIPAQLRKRLAALEHLTDKQIRDVETFLKGENVIQSIVAELEQRIDDTPDYIATHNNAKAMS